MPHSLDDPASANNLVRIDGHGVQADLRHLVLGEQGKLQLDGFAAGQVAGSSAYSKSCGAASRTWSALQARRAVLWSRMTRVSGIS